MSKVCLVFAPKEAYLDFSGTYHRYNTPGSSKQQGSRLVFVRKPLTNNIQLIHLASKMGGELIVSQYEKINKYVTKASAFY
jgi:hypothetical protein